MPLFTFGHGTLEAGPLGSLLTDAGIELLVDVRSHPGSRRHPHVARDEMAKWLPADTGIAYRWEPRLGGRRRTRADSPHVALRNHSFRGYADHMESDEFGEALDRVLAEATTAPTAVMCAETLWWRCHRRLLADAAVLVRGTEVLHLGHDGRLTPHRVTDGARPSAGHVVYDVDADRPLPL